MNLAQAKQYLQSRGLSHVRRCETYAEQCARFEAQRREELEIVQRALTGFRKNNVTPIRRNK